MKTLQTSAADGGVNIWISLTPMGSLTVSRASRRRTASKDEFLLSVSLSPLECQDLSLPEYDDLYS